MHIDIFWDVLSLRVSSWDLKKYLTSLKAAKNCVPSSPIYVFLPKTLYKAILNHFHFC